MTIRFSINPEEKARLEKVASVLHGSKANYKTAQTAQAMMYLGLAVFLQDVDLPPFIQQTS